MLFDIQCVNLGYRLILCHLYIFRVYSHDHLECNSIRLHFFSRIIQHRRKRQPVYLLHGVKSVHREL